ncbi:MAG: hypothetical protein A3C55_03055 [Gammaproteobacteria bacterium RIFCSPHIGHO2_02_FULL_42_13]|nr:MAG: hypothetical protein A3C55_03055 [Gammaproteobacteria bacterium RIFCSPHIGHO2_02_FULL_42_13]OGT67843.1 MAG: hypothetical protein A3H43_04570 [Gammaproteobacteria bacterium RIFCSPLOWO2_02_FULL_42_9]
MTDHNKKTSYILPSIIWSLSAIFYFYEFLLQVSPGVMVPELMHDFSINALAFSNLVAIYFYAYASMQIPVGILLDRFGSRRTLTMATAICAIGSLSFSLAQSWWLIEASRFFIGLGSAFAVVGCMNIAAHWFPPKHFALIIGLTVTVGMLGAITGEAPLALFIHSFGWRHAFLILAAFALVLSILMLFIIRDHPPHHHYSVKNTIQAPLLQGLKTVLSSSQSWVGALYGGLMYAPTPLFGGLWGVTYLINAYNISRHLAAFMTSFIFIGWAVGCPTFGFLSDLLKRRKSPMLIGTLGTLLSISIILYIPHLTLIELFIFLFLFGFFSSALVLIFSTIRELHPSRYSATSLSFVNTVNMIGAAIIPPITGLILEHYWIGTAKHGARVYSAHAYHMALSILPLLILIALWIVPYIHETFCIPVEYNHEKKPPAHDDAQAIH